MFDVRLRLYTPGGVKGRVLKTLSIGDITHVDSGSARVSFTTSELVAGGLEAPLLVGVEHSLGAAWVAPRTNLFIAAEDTSDTVDVSGTVSFTGQDFLSWLMARMYLQGGPGAVEGHREFTSPGDLLRTMILEAQAFGWGPGVSVDFTATHDSNGVAWTAADKPPKMRTGTPMSQVLATISGQGLCEWWVEGQTLRLVRPGTGADRSHIKFGARGFTRAPAKSDFAGVFTDLTVLYDGGNYVNLTNAGADTRFGRLWSIMTQSGVTTSVDATRLAQPTLTQGRAVKQELSFDWTPTTGMPAPWADFQIGDVVKARTPGGWVDQRVIGTVISKDTDGVVKARAMVGDKLLSLVAKLASRSAAATVGTIIGGSGAGIPSSPAQTVPLPEAPTGLHVESNTGAWLPDGTAVSTVELGWNTVTQAVDGSGVTVTSYEVWARRASELSTLLTRTTGPDVTVQSFIPGETRWVKVRAVGVDGRTSEFSDEISVTPASPLSIVPKTPTGLAVTSNTAAFQPDGSSVATLRVQWDAVTLSTDDAPVVIDRYELWTLEGAVWSPVSASPSRDVTVTAKAGQERSFKARAFTTLGVWSDFTAQVDVVAALPGALTTAPTAPSLTSSLGMVQAWWDGALDGGVLPQGVQHVVVEYAPAATGPWTRMSVPMPRTGGSSPIRGTVGETMHVRFVPVDTLGREFTPSTVASIVVVGVAGPDLQANSVTANTIEAGAIEVQHLSNGLGAQIDLGENQVIIQIAAEQQNLADQVGDTAGTVEELSAWFRVDANGAHVGSTGSPFQTHVKPDRFEITDNGVVTSYWEGGRMVVPRLEASEVVLSKHKFEPYGDGTVVRSIG